MVCAACLIPLIGATTAAGGAIQAQKESEREHRKWYLFAVLLGLSAVGYWWYKKSRPSSCNSCTGR